MANYSFKGEVFFRCNPTLAKIAYPLSWLRFYHTFFLIDTLPNSRKSEFLHGPLFGTPASMTRT